MTQTKQFVLLLIVLIATSLAAAQSGSHAITYHIYGNGQISGACDWSNPVSKYSGYITAQTSGLSCFACVQMFCPGTGKTIHVTVVDSGGDGFDLNEPAYIELCGQKGINDGHCQINWNVVANNKCPGNDHGSPATTPKSPPTSPPPSSGKATTTRCGSNWSAANTQCNSACSSNANCKSGQTCFADLKSCTPKAEGDFEVTFDPTEFQLPPTEDGSDFSGFQSGFQSDAAVAAPVSTVIPTVSTTPATDASASTDAPSWAIALIVIGCLLGVAIFCCYYFSCSSPS